MTPFTSTRPHARNPNNRLTGHKIVESILGFVEEIEITNPSLNVVVAGTGELAHSTTFFFVLTQR